MVEVDKLAAEQYCYLTTTGRVTGRPHEIEIWFGLKVGQKSVSSASRRGPSRSAPLTLYMLSGGRERSDWVKNLTKNPSVSVRIGRQAFNGVARRVGPKTDEDREARRLLLDKYAESSGDDLSDWGRNSLPIAVDLDRSPAKRSPRRNRNAG